MAHKILIPEAKQGLSKMKMELAAEAGVNLKDVHDGNLPSSTAGNMVKKMVESYERNLK
ncbi:spore protein [Clostridium polyendosporum]|uniref:Spore protein n=1 Tax=Clostridium polyendosporum TaxID=69208 RepID=A0A919RWP6_9CLOT|nr:alpha/beta-type small acid-soluble spore protein [Clostridium polyendosporum]GIM27699.1 spore protein [Clostridium polyendosporum]